MADPLAEAPKGHEAGEPSQNRVKPNNEPEAGQRRLKLLHKLRDKLREKFRGTTPPDLAKPIETGQDANNPPIQEEPQHLDSNRTELVEKRLRGSRFYEEPDSESRNGYYQGRFIIGRDTPINGGVYLGGGAREAIVVDDAKSNYLNQIYEDLLASTQKSSADNNIPFRGMILDSVFSKVKEILPFNEQEAENIARPFYGDIKVSLDVFIQSKVGVCRHQALLAAYLLERFKNDGHLRGNVSIDRNFVRGKGGHAWVRYANSAGEVFIIDPAQNYIGRLKGMEENGERWFYERPEKSKE